LIHIPASTRTEWTAWLRSQPRGTVVAHIPFAAGRTVKDHEADAWHMFYQIDHGKPIVNGYSGWFPPGYVPFQLEMAQTFPQPHLLCALNKGLYVDTLVVEQGWLATHKTQMAQFSKFLTPAYSDREVEIYRLDMPAEACTQRTGPP
jgi:hypothetical protein